MKDPDNLWKNVCILFAKQSRCKSRKVGCVIVHENHQIGQGWNGPPEGTDVSSCKREKCLNSDKNMVSPLSDAVCCHAEINAISYCSRHGISTRGSVLYCTTHPCIYCAGAIIGCGIKEVVYDEDYTDSEEALKLFQNAGVKVRRFHL